MTRSAGSVPDGRTSTRPRARAGPPRSAMAACRIAGRPPTGPCDGPSRRAVAVAASGCPRRASRAARPVRGHHPQDLERGDDAVAGRRVLEDRSRGRSSRRPSPAPDTCMPSRMYLSPTGVRTTLAAGRLDGLLSPPFERTDTTRPPGSAPRRSRSSARIPSTWSPSTTWPARVDRDQPVGVAVEREPDVGARARRPPPPARPARSRPSGR